MILILPVHMWQNDLGKFKSNIVSSLRDFIRFIFYSCLFEKKSITTSYFVSVFFAVLFFLVAGFLGAAAGFLAAGLASVFAGVFFTFAFVSLGLLVAAEGEENLI